MDYTDPNVTYCPYRTNLLLELGHVPLADYSNVNHFQPEDAESESETDSDRPAYIEEYPGLENPQQEPAYAPGPSVAHTKTRRKSRKHHDPGKFRGGPSEPSAPLHQAPLPQSVAMPEEPPEAQLKAEAASTAPKEEKSVPDTDSGPLEPPTPLSPLPNKDSINKSTLSSSLPANPNKPVAAPPSPPPSPPDAGIEEKPLEEKSLHEKPLAERDVKENEATSITSSKNEEKDGKTSKDENEDENKEGNAAAAVVAAAVTLKTITLADDKSPDGSKRNVEQHSGEEPSKKVGGGTPANEHEKPGEERVGDQAADPSEQQPEEPAHTNETDKPSARVPEPGKPEENTKLSELNTGETEQPNADELKQPESGSSKPEDRQKLDVDGPEKAPVNESMEDVLEPGPTNEDVETEQAAKPTVVNVEIAEDATGSRPEESSPAFDSTKLTDQYDVPKQEGEPSNEALQSETLPKTGDNREEPSSSLPDAPKETVLKEDPDVSKEEIPLNEEANSKENIEGSEEEVDYKENIQGSKEEAVSKEEVSSKEEVPSKEEVIEGSKEEVSSNEEIDSENIQDSKEKVVSKEEAVSKEEVPSTKEVESKESIEGSREEIFPKEDVGNLTEESVSKGKDNDCQEKFSFKENSHGRREEDGSQGEANDSKEKIASKGDHASEELVAPGMAKEEVVVPQDGEKQEEKPCGNASGALEPKEDSQKISPTPEAAIPRAITEAAPETTAEPVTDAVPGATRELAVPETSADAIPEAIREYFPEVTTPEVAPDASAPGAVLGTVAEVEAPEGVSEAIGTEISPHQDVSSSPKIVSSPDSQHDIPDAGKAVGEDVDEKGAKDDSKATVTTDSLPAESREPLSLDIDDHQAPENTHVDEAKPASLLQSGDGSNEDEPEVIDSLRMSTLELQIRDNKEHSTDAVAETAPEKAKDPDVSGNFESRGESVSVSLEGENVGPKENTETVADSKVDTPEHQDPEMSSASAQAEPTGTLRLAESPEGQAADHANDQEVSYITKSNITPEFDSIEPEAGHEDQKVDTKEPPAEEDGRDMDDSHQKSLTEGVAEAPSGHKKPEIETSTNLENKEPITSSYQDESSLTAEPISDAPKVDQVSDPGKSIAPAKNEIQPEDQALEAAQEAKHVEHVKESEGSPADELSRKSPENNLPQPSEEVMDNEEMSGEPSGKQATPEGSASLGALRDETLPEQAASADMAKTCQEDSKDLPSTDETTQDVQAGSELVQEPVSTDEAPQQVDTDKISFSAKQEEPSNEQAMGKLTEGVNLVECEVRQEAESVRAESVGAEAAVNEAEAVKEQESAADTILGTDKPDENIQAPPEGESPEVAAEVTPSTAHDQEKQGDAQTVESEEEQHEKSTHGEDKEGETGCKVQKLEDHQSPIEEPPFPVKEEPTAEVEPVTVPEVQVPDSDQAKNLVQRGETSKPETSDDSQPISNDSQRAKVMAVAEKDGAALDEQAPVGEQSVACEQPVADERSGELEILEVEANPIHEPKLKQQSLDDDNFPVVDDVALSSELDKSKEVEDSMSPSAVEAGKHSIEPKDSGKEGVKDEGPTKIKETLDSNSPGDVGIADTEARGDSSLVEPKDGEILTTEKKTVDDTSVQIYERDTKEAIAKEKSPSSHDQHAVVEVPNETGLSEELRNISATTERVGEVEPQSNENGMQQDAQPVPATEVEQTSADDIIHYGSTTALFESSRQEEKRTTEVDEKALDVGSTAAVSHVSKLEGQVGSQDVKDPDEPEFNPPQTEAAMGDKDVHGTIVKEADGDETHGEKDGVQEDVGTAAVYVDLQQVDTKDKELQTSGDFRTEAAPALERQGQDNDDKTEELAEPVAIETHVIVDDKKVEESEVQIERQHAVGPMPEEIAKKGEGPWLDPISSSPVPTHCVSADDRKPDDMEPGTTGPIEGEQFTAKEKTREDMGDDLRQDKRDDAEDQTREEKTSQEGGDELGPSVDEDKKISTPAQAVEPRPMESFDKGSSDQEKAARVQTKAGVDNDQIETPALPGTIRTQGDSVESASGPADDRETLEQPLEANSPGGPLESRPTLNQEYSSGAGMAEEAVSATKPMPTSPKAQDLKPEAGDEQVAADQRLSDEVLIPQGPSQGVTAPDDEEPIKITSDNQEEGTSSALHRAHGEPEESPPAELSHEKAQTAAKSTSETEMAISEVHHDVSHKDEDQEQSSQEASRETSTDIQQDTSVPEDQGGVQDKLDNKVDEEPVPEPSDVGKGDMYESRGIKSGLISREASTEPEEVAETLATDLKLAVQNIDQTQGPEDVRVASREKEEVAGADLESSPPVVSGHSTLQGGSADATTVTEPTDLHMKEEEQGIIVLKTPPVAAPDPKNADIKDSVDETTLHSQIAAEKSEVIVREEPRLTERLEEQLERHREEPSHSTAESECQVTAETPTQTEEIDSKDKPLVGAEPESSKGPQISLELKTSKEESIEIIPSATIEVGAKSVPADKGPVSGGETVLVDKQDAPSQIRSTASAPPRTEHQDSEGAAPSQPQLKDSSLIREEGEQPVAVLPVIADSAVGTDATGGPRKAFPVDEYLFSSSADPKQEGDGRPSPPEAQQLLAPEKSGQVVSTGKLADPDAEGGGSTTGNQHVEAPDRPDAASEAASHQAELPVDTPPQLFAVTTTEGSASEKAPKISKGVVMVDDEQRAPHEPADDPNLLQKGSSPEATPLEEQRHNILLEAEIKEQDAGVQPRDGTVDESNELKEDNATKSINDVNRAPVLDTLELALEESLDTSRKGSLAVDEDESVMVARVAEATEKSGLLGAIPEVEVVDKPITPTAEERAILKKEEKEKETHPTSPEPATGGSLPLSNTETQSASVHKQPKVYEDKPVHIQTPSGREGIKADRDEPQDTASPIQNTSPDEAKISLEPSTPASNLPGSSPSDVVRDTVALTVEHETTPEKTRELTGSSTSLGGPEEKPSSAQSLFFDDHVKPRSRDSGVEAGASSASQAQPGEFHLSSETPTVPDPWITQWDSDRKRWLFVNTTTSHTQWERPHSCDDELDPAETSLDNRSRDVEAPGLDPFTDSDNLAAMSNADEAKDEQDSRSRDLTYSKDQGFDKSDGPTSRPGDSAGQVKGGEPLRENMKQVKADKLIASAQKVEYKEEASGPDSSMKEIGRLASPESESLGVTPAERPVRDAPPQGAVSSTKPKHKHESDNKDSNLGLTSGASGVALLTVAGITAPSAVDEMGKKKKQCPDIPARRSSRSASPPPTSKIKPSLVSKGTQTDDYYHPESSIAQRPWDCPVSPTKIGPRDPSPAEEYPGPAEVAPRALSQTQSSPHLGERTKSREYTDFEERINGIDVPLATQSCGLVVKPAPKSSVDGGVTREQDHTLRKSVTDLLAESKKTSIHDLHAEKDATAAASAEPASPGRDYERRKHHRSHRHSQDGSKESSRNSHSHRYRRDSDASRRSASERTLEPKDRSHEPQTGSPTRQRRQDSGFSERPTSSRRSASERTLEPKDRSHEPQTGSPTRQRRQDSGFSERPTSSRRHSHQRTPEEQATQEKRRAERRLAREREREREEREKPESGRSRGKEFLPSDVPPSPSRRRVSRRHSAASSTKDGYKQQREDSPISVKKFPDAKNGEMVTSNKMPPQEGSPPPSSIRSGRGSLKSKDKAAGALKDESALPEIADEVPAPGISSSSRSSKGKEREHAASDPSGSRSAHAARKRRRSHASDSRPPRVEKPLRSSSTTHSAREKMSNSFRRSLDGVRHRFARISSDIAGDRRGWDYDAHNTPMTTAEVPEKSASGGEKASVDRVDLSDGGSSPSRGDSNNNNKSSNAARRRRLEERRRTDSKSHSRGSGRGDKTASSRPSSRKDKSAAHHNRETREKERGGRAAAHGASPNSDEMKGGFRATLKRLFTGSP